MRNNLAKNCGDKLLYFLAIGFGAGLSPLMPGTVGSLVGILFVLLLAKLSLGAYLLVSIILFGGGVFICGRVAAKFFTSSDPGAIVWDEIVGMLITMVLIPVTAVNLALGFISFRVFDIWKPWPIRLAEKQCSSGFGIMFDDIIAGVYANVAVNLLLCLIK